MKVNVKHKNKGCLYEDIAAGEIFYSETEPYRYLLRTDDSNTDYYCWAAVNIETGEMYDENDFDHDNPQYHIVKAEITIS